MQRRLGSVTLSQLAFSGEGNLNFSREKSHLANTVVKSKKKKSESSDFLHEPDEPDDSYLVGQANMFFFSILFTIASM